MHIHRHTHTHTHMIITNHKNKENCIAGVISGRARVQMRCRLPSMNEDHTEALMCLLTSVSIQYEIWDSLTRAIDK